MIAPAMHHISRRRRWAPRPRMRRRLLLYRPKAHSSFLITKCPPSSRRSAHGIVAGASRVHHMALLLARLPVRCKGFAACQVCYRPARPHMRPPLSLLASDMLVARRETPLLCSSSSARRIASRVMPPVLPASMLRLQQRRRGDACMVGWRGKLRGMHRGGAEGPWQRAIRRLAGPPLQLLSRAAPHTPSGTARGSHLKDCAPEPPFFEARRRSCTVMRTRSTACSRVGRRMRNVRGEGRSRGGLTPLLPQALAGQQRCTAGPRLLDGGVAACDVQTAACGAAVHAACLRERPDQLPQVLV